MKTCSKCKEQKELSEFHNDKSRKDGYFINCRLCDYAYRKKINSTEERKKWQKQYNKERFLTAEGRLYAANYSLKKNYGISMNEYRAMLEAQNGCCKICKKHYSRFTRRLHVDHNHETGKIRELLCHHCNAAIGLLDESIDLFLEAINYLRSHNAE